MLNWSSKNFHNTDRYSFEKL